MKNRYTLLCAAVAVISMVMVSCGGSTPPPATATPAPASTGPKTSADAQKYAALKGDPVNGQTKYATTCIACHGPEAKGMPNLGKDMTTSAFLKGISDADAVLFLTKGRPSSDPLNTTKVDMPPRGGNPSLKDQDLADIIAFVRTLQK